MKRVRGYFPEGGNEMKKLKVFIYCRVLSEEARYLLEYQEDILRENADMLNIEVFAVAREIGNGKNFGSRGMEKLIYYVINEKINAIFIYDKTRICIYNELFAEFKILCDKHNVFILTMDELKFLCNKSLFLGHDE